MDLHLTNARATAEERAAVDSDLGAPQSSWQGAQRQTVDTRAAFSGDATNRRHRLLPLLHRIQNRIGWISPGAVNYVALRLNVAPAEVHGVASFYGMFSLQPRPRVVAHICDDIACVTQGSEKLCAELESTLGPAGSPCSDGRAIWLRSQCLGLCERAPAALVTSAGEKSHERVLAPASAEAGLLWQTMRSTVASRRTRRAQRQNQRAPGSPKKWIVAVATSPPHCSRWRLNFGSLPKIGRLSRSA